MLNFVIEKVFGSPNSRYLKRINNIVNEVNLLSNEISSLNDEDFPKKTLELKDRFAKGESLDEILPYAFALVREASFRSIGLRHYDVQVCGAIALHQGHIAQMGTGEGKTLVATMPAYLNSLSGNSVHVVTVNDYLAKRDAEWMQPVYSFLGVDVSFVSGDLNSSERKEAYNSDIVYVTNTEVVFDFLRDNMATTLENKVQRELSFVIVDEVDSVLIDNARTPVVISGSVSHDVDMYSSMQKVALELKMQQDENDDGDFKIDEKHKQAFLTENGHVRAEKLLRQLNIISSGTGLYDSENIAVIHYLMSSLKANYLMHRDVNYVVKDNEVVIIDEHSGRAVPGRRWGDGLHQAVEAKEQLEIQQESQTLASITFQNFFRQYQKISGMTGTAETEAHEFSDVYGLSVVSVPANQKVIRDDQSDVIYLRQEKKYEAIVNDIISSYEKGQPVLVGTVSIEISELVSSMLQHKNIPHNVLNAKHHQQEAEIISNAGRKGAVTIATNMAGRGTDIVLGGCLESEIKDDMGDQEVAEIKERWVARNEEVKQLGGLKIIGSERHESRRIDNQLRGRSGRQGDPGTTKFYLSLEDNLMRIFASDKVQELMQRLGMSDNDTISAPMLTRAIENAQKKVEGHNYDIRKQLLEFDDIANDQRKVIFSQRNELLSIKDVSDVINNMRQTVISRTLDIFAPAEDMLEDWDIDSLEASLVSDFNERIDLKSWSEGDDVHRNSLEEMIVSRLENSFNEKADLVGHDVIRDLEHKIMLQVIDLQWKEHLATMDHLRHGIHLRGYAQRNPLQEYKRESYEIFTKMLDNIKFETIKKLQSVRLVNKQEDQEVRRNDSCPCGSGEKYKHCHGKIMA
jgi:preprotein translocase subunit SecA